MCDKYRQCEEVWFGQFQIQGVLPPGTSGICYRVKHVEWEAPLRLKKVEVSETTRPLLTHAWKRWIGLSAFPHVASAHGFWEEDGCAWLLTDWVPGLNLLRHVAERLRQRDEALEISLQLAHALNFAHRNHLAHGAVKPENVLLSANDVAVLGDFSPVEAPGNDFSDAIARDRVLYARILRMLFYSVPFDAPAEQKGAPRWELPESLSSCTQALLSPDSPLSDMAAVALEIRKIFQEISPVKYYPIFPSQWRLESLHKHALACMSAGKRERAERLWNFAISRPLFSFHALWNIYLFSLREKQISYEEVRRGLDEYRDRIPVSVACAQAELALERGVDIHASLSRIREISRAVEPTPGLVRLEGDLAYRAGEFGAAMDRYETVAAENPDAENFYRLAAAALAAGDLQRSLAACRSGMTVNRRHCLLGLLEIYLRFRQGEEGIGEELERMVREQPGILWPRVHAGAFFSGRDIYSGQPEQKEKALIHFTAARKLDPFHIDALQGALACGGNADPPVPEDPPSDRWSEVRCFSGHTEMVTAVALSKDQRSLVSGDCEGNIRFRDLEGSSSSALLQGHSKHVTDLVFAEDARHLVSASWDQTARLWSLPSGECLWVMKGHENKISCADATPDVSLAITGSWDGTARVWDTRKKEEVCHVSMGDAVTDVALTADGLRALSCNRDEKMWLWAVSTQRLLGELEGRSVKISRNGKVAVSATRTHILVWDLESCDLKKRIETRERQTCLGLSDSLDLLTRSENDILSIWDLNCGSKVAVLSPEDTLGGDIAASGKRIACGRNEAVYVFANIADEAFPVLAKACYLPPETKETRGLGLIQDLWEKALEEREAGRRESSVQRYAAMRKIPGYEHNQEIAREISSAAEEAKARREALLDVHLLTEQATPAGATFAAVACGGEIALLASHDDPVCLWNCRSGYPVDSFRFHRRWVSGVAISADGHIGLSASWDGTLAAWRMDLPESRARRRIEPPRPASQNPRDSWITALAMDRSGKRALCGTRGGSSFVCDMDSEKSIALRSGGTPVVRAAIDEGGRRGVCSCLDGTIEVRDLQEGALLQSVRPHRRLAAAVAVSADGEFVISATRPGEILCWKALSGEVVARFEQKEPICGVASIDANSILSISQYGLLRMWKIGASSAAAEFFLLGNEEIELAAWSLCAEKRLFLAIDEQKASRLFALEWSWSFGESEQQK